MTQPSQPDDPTPPPAAPPSLLRRVLARDPAAWRQLVHLCSPLTYYWLRRAGLERDAAFRVGWAVFLALGRDLHLHLHAHALTCSFLTLLRRTTQQQVNDHQDRQLAPPVPEAVTRPLIPPHEETEQTAVADHNEHRLLFLGALELLRPEFDERCWQAFEGLALDARRPEEVAADLGLTLADVFLARARVFRRLREEFENILDI